MRDREFELEFQRQNRLDEAACDADGAIADGYRPGTVGCHELLDRLLITTRFLDDSLLYHPALLLVPEWFAVASQSVDLLNGLYQQVGASQFGYPNSADPPPTEPREKGQLS